MVAEVDPLETYEKRKSNEDKTEVDDSICKQREGDTAATKSELAHSTMNVVESDRKETSPQSKSLAPVYTIVTAPVLVTKAENPHIATEVRLNCHDPYANLIQTDVALSTKSTQSTTAIMHSNPKDAARTTHPSNDIDLDSVNDPKRCPLSNEPSSSSNTATVEASHKLPASIVQSKEMTSTNGKPPFTMGLGLQTSKRVSFTGTPPPSSIVEGRAKHQSTHPLPDVNKESEIIQKPQANPLSPGGSASTASKLDEATEPLAAITRSENLGPTDETQKARMPLVGPYGSVIHPTDTSLVDARKRLRKALDQTRILRAAFSDRVYEKYKVILRPVPNCVDSIITRITADPIERKSQLMEEIRAIKEEKELEKKEAQTLAAAGIFNVTGSDGKHPPASQASNAETADQLAYIGAGLNLVILPEEDMQGSGIEIGKYEYRGPINAETGHRVGGISAAAATAAEAILDRVRRSTMLRNERQRRHQNGPDADGSNDSSSTNNTILSRYHLLSSTTTTSIATPKISDPKVPQIAPKQIKKATQTKSVTSTTSSSKPGRSLSQPVVSIESILSMNPLAEDQDRRPSASTSALLARGVDRKSTLLRWRHPHPDSLAARKPPATLSSRNPEVTRYGTGLEAFSGKASLDMKLTIDAVDRRQKKAIAFYDRTKVMSHRAKNVLESILSQFVSPDDSNTYKSEGYNGERETDVSCKALKVDEGKRNRRATEIGLLHGMQHSVDGEGKTAGSTVTRTAEVAGAQSVLSVPTQVTTEQSDQDVIEPIVAFSVLQALGLVHDTHLSHRDQADSVWPRLLQASSVVDSRLLPQRIGPSSRFLNLHRKVTSKKRSFSEAFSSESSAIGSQTQAFSNVAKTSPTISVDESHDVCNDSNGDRAEDVTTTMAAEGEEMACDDSPVVFIRGGGGGADDEYVSQFAAESERSEEDGDVTVEAPKRPGSAPSRGSARPLSSSSAAGRVAQNMRASSSDGLFSTLAHSRINTHGSAGGAFSPQRNAGFGLAAATAAAAHQGVVNQLHAQAHAHQLQLQAAALNRISPGGDLSNFFGAGLHQRQSFASHADWAALGSASQASASLLPSRSSLAALGLNHHQAAMLELNARDRATRAMLAREHQASAVHAAAVRQVSAMRGAGSMSGLSSQHAAAMISAQASQAGAGLFSTSSASRFGQLGGHSAASAAAILSSPAAAALIGQSQLSLGAMSGHLGLSQRADSRPSSQHSMSSAKSSRGKPCSSKIRKEHKPDALQAASAELSMSEKSKNSDDGKHSSAKRKSSELTQITDNEEISGVQEEKSTADEPSDDRNTNIVQQPGADSPPRKKLAVTAVRPDSKKPDSAPASSQQAPLVAAGSEDDLPPAILEDSPSIQAAAGMQFCVPPIPPSLEPQMAVCALDGRIHIAISDLFLPSGQLLSISSATAFLDFIQAVGAAVPIPKALVSNPLKERLNIQTLKMSSNGGHAPSIPRDVVAAIVLVWLWVQHKDSFQSAFAKSGRIDVDPECKWLIQAAVDAASRALMSELTENVQNGGLLASALSSARNKGGSGLVKPSGNELDKQAAASITADARVALIVSEALMTELCIDEEVDVILPIYEDAVQLLDETRELALKAKCRERVLLAALIAQCATMSDAFADGYVSSMVRAGEALDHGELFEMVQDEETSTSTMIPYDIFSDETRAWEDPCRPANGFTPNLSGEDLVRRAHARAMIIKSLKKMQDLNCIKGGTSDSGPYAERTPSQGQSLIEAKALQRTQSGSLKRRASFSLPEQPVRTGTGSGQPTTVNQYNPQHICTPLFWDTTSIENMPYGQYSHAFRIRSLSLSSPELIKGDAIAAPSQQGLKDDGTGSGIVRRSTEEIDWSDVAKAFVTVDLAEGPTPSRRRVAKLSLPVHQEPRNRLSTTIFAPFCNRIDDSLAVSGESDSGEEEDLADETILRRHQVVLDSMKERLDKFMEGRTTAGQRARQRAQARAAEK